MEGLSMAGRKTLNSKASAWVEAPGSQEGEAGLGSNGKLFQVPSLVRKKSSFPPMFSLDLFGFSFPELLTRV